MKGAKKKSVPIKYSLVALFLAVVLVTVLIFNSTLDSVPNQRYLPQVGEGNEFGEVDSYEVIEDPFGDFELIFGAIKNCLKVAEIPVHYYPREYGESKAYGNSVYSFFKHGWLLVKMSWIAFVKFIIKN